MNELVPPQPRRKRGMLILLGAFFVLAALMYVSIMVKIIKYGP